MRDCVKAYHKALCRKHTSTEIGDDLEVMELPSKKRGRPLLLVEKIGSGPSSEQCVTMEQ